MTSAYATEAIADLNRGSRHRRRRPLRPSEQSRGPSHDGVRMLIPRFFRIASISAISGSTSWREHCPWLASRLASPRLLRARVRQARC